MDRPLSCHRIELPSHCAAVYSLGKRFGTMGHSTPSFDIDNLFVLEDDQRSEYDPECCCTATHHQHHQQQEKNSPQQAQTRAATATSQHLSDAPHNGSTAIANGLSQQLIYQMNLIQANTLVSVEALNIDLDPAAYPLLQPAAKAALARAIEARGTQLLLNSGYRTIAQQQILYNGRHSNFNPVARPGRSRHQSGLAIDIEDFHGWRPYLEAEGWHWLGAGDPPHFDYVDESSIPLGNFAIQAFQELWNQNYPEHKLLVDGRYGPQTERCLNRSPLKGFKISPWANNPRMIRLQTPRMEGSDIVALQEKLIAAGLEQITADGIFGPQTDKAVREFQSTMALSVDGIVGNQTRTKLSQVIPKSPVNITIAAAKDVLAQTEPTLKARSSNIKSIL